MATQRYSVTPHPIKTILGWVEQDIIAIPEIQRPFVWEATKVRDLLDSLYQGYPVGYLISWKNPDVRTKDGSLSVGKRILIDGQQRVTALMAALLGQEVLTKDYDTVRIRISFNPQTERFEVANPAILKDPAWIPDIAPLFNGTTSGYELIKKYEAANSGVDGNSIARVIDSLLGLQHNYVGIIDLAEDLDIETVTEIFIRVNSTGVALSQADFAMSKIASNEAQGGHQLRKAIDYFCRLAVAPDFAKTIEKQDAPFTKTRYYAKMHWLRNVNDDLYDPSYTDVLRVAFMSQFRRAKLQDLVALLSGRNFETRQYESDIVERSFADLEQGVLRFMNETSFKKLLMILRSAGFVDRSLMGSRNAVNFAYVAYLIARDQETPQADIEGLVRRWYAFSVLTGRHSGSFETTFDNDVRGMELRGATDYANQTIASELDEGFWSTRLPDLLETSSTTSPYFSVFKAAQAKLHDRGFLSSDITVHDLLVIHGDAHHVYPKNHLKKQGLAPGKYNQIANLVMAQSEINIAIGDKAPSQYFHEIAEQCDGGPKRYGNISDRAAMAANFAQNAIPLALLDGDVHDYPDFLDERRRLMAKRIRHWYENL